MVVKKYLQPWLLKYIFFTIIYAIVIKYNYLTKKLKCLYKIEVFDEKHIKHYIFPFKKHELMIVKPQRGFNNHKTKSKGLKGNILYFV